MANVITPSQDIIAKHFEDVDIYGRETVDGEAIVHIDDFALSNALVFWATSKRGDFLYQPNEGGPLDFLKFKPLYKEKEVANKFLDKINSAFGIYITLLKMSVIPDYESRVWQFDVIYKSNLTGTKNQVQFFVRGKFPENRVEEIDYTGTNLINFVSLVKPDMGKQLLRKRVDSLYSWGNFVFTNLTETSPEYSEVLAIINS